MFQGLLVWPDEKKAGGVPGFSMATAGLRPQIGNLQPAAFLRRFGFSSPLSALAEAFFAGALSFFGAASFFFFFSGLSPAGAAGAASDSTSCMSAIGAESPGRGPILRIRV